MIRRARGECDAAHRTFQEGDQLAERRNHRDGGRGAIVFRGLIGLALRIGLDRAALTRYRDALASLGMRPESRLETSMGTLSGGQRQAVTLLMATIARPELLLLDEHTAALDPRAAEQIMDVTDRVVRTHRLTTLMVTHGMDQAVRFAELSHTADTRVTQGLARSATG